MSRLTFYRNPSNLSCPSIYCTTALTRITKTKSTWLLHAHELHQESGYVPIPMELRTRRPLLSSVPHYIHISSLISYRFSFTLVPCYNHTTSLKSYNCLFQVIYLRSLILYSGASVWGRMHCLDEKDEMS